MILLRVSPKSNRLYQKVCLVSKEETYSGRNCIKTQLSDNVIGWLWVSVALVKAYSENEFTLIRFPQGAAGGTLLLSQKLAGMCIHF